MRPPPLIQQRSNFVVRRSPFSAVILFVFQGKRALPYEKRQGRRFLGGFRWCLSLDFGSSARKGNKTMKHLAFMIIICSLIGLTGCANETSNSDTSSEASFEASSEPTVDFTGIPGLKDTEGISALNNKESMYHPFCFNEEQIYFANPRDGQFLYSYDGEQLTRLNEIPVYDLNYFDNAVYFLSNGEPFNPQDYTAVGGYLYRYDLSERKTEKLSDFIMRSPIVTGDGVFYQNLDENNVPQVFKFDGSSTQTEPLYSSFSIQHYNGFHIYNNIPEKTKLGFFISNGEENYQLPIEGIPRFDCIVNGKYYYKTQGEGSLKSIDLSTGEQNKITPDDDFVVDYTVFNGTEYLLLHNGKLAVCKNGEVERLNCDNQQFKFIFSGKSALYALKCKWGSGKEEYDLVELTVDGDNVHSNNITSPVDVGYPDTITSA